MRNFLIFEKSIVYGKIIRKLKPKVPLEYTSLLMIINLTLSVLFKRIYLNNKNYYRNYTSSVILLVLPSMNRSEDARF